MKLECAVVKDLYVLYFENELSAEVKEAVEEHLRECEHCRNSYCEETNFGDMLDTHLMEPSKKLDEKLMMKLKISRLKTAIFFITTIFTIILFNSYSQSRTYVNQDFNTYSSNIHLLKLQLDDLKKHTKVIENERNLYNRQIGELLSTTNKTYEFLYRNVNPLEKLSLKKIGRNQCFDLSVTTLILTLNNRYENGHWSEKDEKVYNTLMDEIKTIWYDLGNQSPKTNSKFYILKTKNIVNSIKKINELAKYYATFNKLPEEVTLLSKNELKNKLSTILGVGEMEIKLSNYYDFSHNFQVKLTKTENLNGRIDAYSGRIFDLNGGSSTKKETVISAEDAKQMARALVLRNYGDIFQTEIENLGINYNIQSTVEIKIYTFKVQTFYKGYKIFSPVIVRIDATTGNIYGLYPQESTTVDRFSLPTDLIFKENLRPEKALEDISLEKLKKEDFVYYDTFFIKSMFSGKYVLVHAYKEKDKNIPQAKTFYINANTGGIESQTYHPNAISY